MKRHGTALLAPNNPLPRLSLLFVSIAAAFILAACTGSQPVDSIKVDLAQGSESNIASLTEVVDKNPQSAEAFNVRGTAFGLAGKHKEALADFGRAIELNPRFYKAYANRALVHRALNDPVSAVNAYTKAISINAQYDEAMHG